MFMGADAEEHVGHEEEKQGASDSHDASDDPGCRVMKGARRHHGLPMNDTKTDHHHQGKSGCEDEVVKRENTREENKRTEPQHLRPQAGVADTCPNLECSPQKVQG